MIGILKVVVPILALVLVGAGVVALTTATPRLAPDRDEKEGATTGTETVPAPRPTIPPIGAAAPIRTETATFALG